MREEGGRERDGDGGERGRGEGERNAIISIISMVPVSLLGLLGTPVMRDTPYIGARRWGHPSQGKEEGIGC